MFLLVVLVVFVWWCWWCWRWNPLENIAKPLEPITKRLETIGTMINRALTCAAGGAGGVGGVGVVLLAVESVRNHYVETITKRIETIVSH